MAYIDEIEELLKTKNEKMVKLEEYNKVLCEYFEQRNINYKASFYANSKEITIEINEYYFRISIKEIEEYELNKEVDTETAFRYLIKEKLSKKING